MDGTINLRDDLAAALLLPGQEPARAALEAVGLEAYRQRRITAYQLRLLLGIEARYEIDRTVRSASFLSHCDVLQKIVGADAGSPAIPEKRAADVSLFGAPYHRKISFNINKCFWFQPKIGAESLDLAAVEFPLLSNEF